MIIRKFLFLFGSFKNILKISFLVFSFPAIETRAILKEMLRKASIKREGNDNVSLFGMLNCIHLFI